MADSDNLGIPEIADNATQKELGISTNFNQVDNATQGALSIAFTANARTLTADEFTNDFEFKPSGLTDAGTLTVPLSRRFFAVDNRSGGDDIVVAGTSGSSTTVGAGRLALLRNDGTNVYEFTSVTGTGVASVLGATGAISLADLTGGGVAPKASPALTGTVDASGADVVLIPTADFGSSSTIGASTEFVQTAVDSGLMKPRAAWATDTALPANAYSNGTAGVGAFLAGTANGALVVDGGNPAVDDIVLVKSEAAALGNGLYVVSQAGDASNPYILIRHEAMDQPREFPGAIVVVTGSGAAFPEAVFVCSNGADPTLGTDAITFAGVTVGTWNASTVNHVGANLDVNGGTLDLAALTGDVLIGHAGTGTAVPTTIVIGGNLGINSGTVDLKAVTGDVLFGHGGAGTATPGALAIGPGLTIAGGTIDTVAHSSDWSAGAVSHIGDLFDINSGGTFDFAPLAAATLLGNAGTAAALPEAIAIGDGLAFAGGTLSATGGADEWTAGAVGHIGALFDINSGGTLDFAALTGDVLIGHAGAGTAVPATLAVGENLAISSGTIDLAGTIEATLMNAGTIDIGGTAGLAFHAFGTEFSSTSGTLHVSGAGGGSSTLTPNIQTASYTIQATDVGKLVIFNSTSAVTATFPSLSTIGADNVVELSNINTGVVTVTVGGSNGTIDAGGTSYSLSQSQFARQINDGTNWATERGLGGTAVGAAGGIAFGSSNAVGSNDLNGFIAGIGNNGNNGAIILGITNTATTGNFPIVIGASNVGAAQQIVLIGNANTLSGFENLMIANSSSNSASNPFPAFGQHLLISGSGGGVAVGNSIVATGTISFPQGYQANDHGNALGHYRGQNGPANSDATPTQREEYTFWNINHGTVAVSLSNNGAAPSATVVGNPGTKTVGFVRCEIVIVDRSNGNAVSYYTATPGIFSKGTNAASMTVNATLTAGATVGSGLSLAAAPTLAADTTNGGFSIGYTPPVGNTDTLWAVAWLDPKVTPGIA